MHRALDIGGRSNHKLDAMTFLLGSAVVLLVSGYLVGGWSRLLGKAPRLLGLKPFQDKASGLSDLLNWAALVDEGIVQTKSGALIAGFFYQGRDIASSTDAERNYIAQRVNTTLARLGSGWVTWHDAVRMSAPAYSPRNQSRFPDPISAAIDEERRQHFMADGELFESHYALTIMYTPPARRNSKVVDFIYDDDATNGDAPGTRILEQFKKNLGDIEDALGDLFGMRRMQSFALADRFGHTVRRDELVNFLNFTLTGSLDPVNIPDPPMYLDAYLGISELWPGDTPRLGEQFIQVIAIAGFPSESYPNILGVLDTLPIPYRWSTRFLYLDPVDALAALGAFRRKWRQKMTGLAAQVFRTKNATVNQDAVSMATEVDTAITETHSNLVTYGYYTGNIVVMGSQRSTLVEHARYVAREITRMGFAARVETVNTIEAWLGTLPGHPHPNIRRPLLHTRNLADLLPLASVWSGLNQNPCPFYSQPAPPLMHVATTGATPFRLNLHHGDLGHSLIFGPTGAGKSVLLATLAAQCRRYPKASITAFDKGRSMYALASATGGKHYDLAGDTASPGLCPLAYLDSESDAAWAEEWLCACFTLQVDHAPTPRQREEIHRAIALLRKSAEGRSLTDFVATVQDAELRSAMANYTIDGSLGPLLDARDDGLADSAFMVFEIEELMGLGEKNLIPVLLYLFRRFERSLKGQPAYLFLDEAWIMLGHPVFRDKIREWLKVLRKANCAVILSTQSLSDAVQSGILDVLLESCPTKILLPNEEADKAGSGSVLGPRDLYTLVGLNEAEIDILKNAQKKRHYYYISPAGRRLFELCLGPVALSFVAVSDKATLAQLRALSAQHGSDWPFVWLKTKGIAHESPKSEAAA
jgi:type IV secretion/conjugal transfer VirB4 family ATPase